MSKEKIIEKIKKEIIRYFNSEKLLKPKMVLEYDMYYQITYGICLLLFDKNTGKLIETEFINVLSKVSGKNYKDVTKEFEEFF